MDSPDYSRYLESVYPGTKWDTARIPRGSINATLKIQKISGDIGPQVLVLKHASAFFEDDGSRQPFSINRQVKKVSCISYNQISNSAPFV